MTSGRNELCPCGSGKKFKHCCLRAELAAAETPQQILHRRVRAAIQSRDAQEKTPLLDMEITQMLRRELGLPEDPITHEGSGA